MKKPTDDLLDELAEESGLAVVVVDEDSSVFKANNNSICRTLYASQEFAPRCEQYCGRAFEMAVRAGKSVSYRCHADLDCVAVPIAAGEKPLVAIVGRAFTKAENYRHATERMMSGDWSKFPPETFFENVLLSSSLKNLEETAKRLENLSDDEKSAILRSLRSESAAGAGLVPEEYGGAKVPWEDIDDDRHTGHSVQNATASGPAEITHTWDEPPVDQSAEAIDTGFESLRKSAEEREEIAAWRSLFGSLLDLSYREASRSVMQFLTRRYGLSSLAWLKREDDRFKSILATGSLEDQPFQIGLVPNDGILLGAAQRGLALKMRRRSAAGQTAKPQTILLFPVAVGGEVQSALVVGDRVTDENLKRHISRFCQTVASELEILRLREEVERRNWLAGAVEKFNDNLKNIDSEDFWMNLTQISAELMRAERTSLLVFDEKSDSLRVKAAIGSNADTIRNETKEVGGRFARTALHDGKPIVVQDVGTMGLPAAPADWKYKSKSFISYPFVIGERKIGVLNVTDKADGGPYSELDLELLEAIAPQVALMIDRAALKNKAGEFEQLSVTDALTGLLNRRYLEERLVEEVKRSHRYGYPVSFMMIDVDRFKSYNDTYGHPEGDKALRIIGQVLRESLRGEDVAARYGGEEFSILLPQTTSSEAETIAERIRERVALIDFQTREITISIGIATCRSAESAQSLINAADKALYEAKRRGRNNVQVYEKLRDAVDAEKKR